MKYYVIILVLFMAGAKQTELKFKPGDCALFIDQPKYVFDKTMLVKVEGFKDGHYLYRWWVLQGGWSVEKGKAIGEQSMFDRLFKVVECPDSVPASVK